MRNLMIMLLWMFAFAGYSQVEHRQNNEKYIYGNKAEGRIPTLDNRGRLVYKDPSGLGADSVEAIILSTITGGYGIDFDPVTGIITNTLPDQTVSLTAGSKISITGTYPNFTIAGIPDTATMAGIAATVNQVVYGVAPGVQGQSDKFTSVIDANNFVLTTTGGATRRTILRADSNFSGMSGQYSAGSMAVPGLRLQAYRHNGSLTATTGLTDNNANIFDFIGFVHVGSASFYSAGQLSLSGDGAIVGNSFATKWTFHTSSTAGANTEKMRINSVGRVGVGVTAPTSALDVAGDVEIGSSNAFILGDPTTNGSWRITISGADLVIQKRESGSWVTKSTITP